METGPTAVRRLTYRNPELPHIGHGPGPRRAQRGRRFFDFFQSSGSSLASGTPAHIEPAAHPTPDRQTDDKLPDGVTDRTSVMARRNWPLVPAKGPRWPQVWTLYNCDHRSPPTM